VSGEGEKDRFVSQVIRDWRAAGLDPASAALCEYAEGVTRAPGLRHPDDLERLRQAGLTDRAIHDATQVIGYFNYINRMADALGVDEETWLRRWEEIPDADDRGD
jgi:uncharacterized peroxidase-related enzyme